MDVPIHEIVLDPRLQMRTKIDMAVVDEYATVIDDLPACKIVEVDHVKFCTSGFHRINAHIKAGKDTVKCQVRTGTFQDAVVEACGENHHHGIRPTDADKKRAVLALLTLDGWQDKSDRVIADACHVSHPFVAKVRADHPTGNVSSCARTGKDGRKRGPKTYCTHCQTLMRKGLEPKKNCTMCKDARKTGKKRSKRTHDDKKDGFGNVLPFRCRAAYCDPWVQASIDFLGVTSAAFWRKRLADGMDKRKKHYPHYNAKDFIDGYTMAGTTIDQILEHLRSNRPAGVCPGCAGEGCPSCKMSGLVTRADYKLLKDKQ